jgi:V/A-type H+-transporting ATPase subunit A
MENRQRLMSLLQDEASLNEIVQMVGMDALSAGDRLKMEAARSVREDFLQQNGFHEVDTYSSLSKQLLIMKLVLAYYDKALEAVEKGASIKVLAGLPVREAIGRFKYTEEKDMQQQFDTISAQLDREMAGTIGKEDF